MSKYTTHFKGQSIDKELAKHLFLANVNEDGKIYFTYTVVNKLNGCEYSGKKQATGYGPLMRYKGSGSIVRHMFKQYGEDNFEMHITGFYDSSVAARLAEATIVNDYYIHRKDTYNIAPGGNERPAADTDAVYHCPKTLKQFQGYKTQEDKFKNFGFVKGISPKSLANNSLWTLQGRKETSLRTRKVKLIHEKEIKHIRNEEVKDYLEDGAVFQSTRVWMHLPNPTNTFERGKTLTQPQAGNPHRILKMIDAGWKIGHPSKF